jgi:hypothetical protein
MNVDSTGLEQGPLVGPAVRAICREAPKGVEQQGPPDPLRRLRNRELGSIDRLRDSAIDNALHGLDDRQDGDRRPVTVRRHDDRVNEGR